MRSCWPGVPAIPASSSSPYARNAWRGRLLSRTSIAAQPRSQSGSLSFRPLLRFLVRQDAQKVARLTVQPDAYLLQHVESDALRPARLQLPDGRVGNFGVFSQAVLGYSTFG